MIQQNGTTINVPCYSLTKNECVSTSQRLN